MGRVDNFHFDPSLCWDCALSTRPWRCEWVARYEPVPGWEARKHHCGSKSDGYESRKVIACPKFVRDSFCGGLTDDPINHKRIKLDDTDVRTLAEAIIERAVEDWKELKRGELEKAYTSDGNTVKREELISFFYSKEFAVLLNSFTKFSPAQIRTFLDVHDRSYYTEEAIAARKENAASQTLT